MKKLLARLNNASIQSYRMMIDIDGEYVLLGGTFPVATASSKDVVFKTYHKYEMKKHLVVLINEVR